MSSYPGDEYYAMNVESERRKPMTDHRPDGEPPCTCSYSRTMKRFDATHCALHMQRPTNRPPTEAKPMANQEKQPATEADRPECLHEFVSNTVGGVMRCVLCGTYQRASALSPASAGLVERLRAHFVDCFGCQQRGMCEEGDALVAEAADALEARERELAEAKAYNALRDENYYTEQRARLAAESDLTACQCEREALKTANEKAVSILSKRFHTHCCSSCDLTDDEREWKERHIVEVGQAVQALRAALETLRIGQA